MIIMQSMKLLVLFFLILSPKMIIIEENPNVLSKQEFINRKIGTNNENNTDYPNVLIELIVNIIDIISHIILPIWEIVQLFPKFTMITFCYLFILPTL